MGWVASIFWICLLVCIFWLVGWWFGVFFLGCYFGCFLVCFISGLLFSPKGSRITNRFPALKSGLQEDVFLDRRGTKMQ